MAEQIYIKIPTETPTYVKLSNDTPIVVKVAGTGMQGAQGIQGLTGPSGSQGPQGIQGLQGIQGPSGSKGDTGLQGIQGVIGPSGSQGIQGIQGPSGSQGLQGIQGITGPTGSQGIQGPSGSQGPIGLAGPSGSQGPQGIQGVAGPSGSISDTSLFVQTSQTSSMTVLSSSFASTAQTLLGSVVSASFALTASYAMNGGSGGTTIDTSSLIQNSQTSSMNVAYATMAGGTSYVTVSSPMTMYKLPLNFSSTVVALADVPTWKFPVYSGSSYRVEIVASYQSAALTTGGKMGVYMSGSGEGSIYGYMKGAISSGSVATNLETTINLIGASNKAGSWLSTTAVAPASQSNHWIGDMLFHCTQSGVFGVQWATKTAASYSQLNSGSAIIVTSLNGPVGLVPPTSTITGTDINWMLSNNFAKTLDANTTFTFSNTSDGQTINVTLTNTTYNYTVTWPTVIWKGGLAPTQTIGNKSDIYTFLKNGGTIYGSVSQNY